jgi:ferredoxin
MKVIIRRETCIGGGQCVSVAQTVFSQDDDGLVVLLKPKVSSADAEAVREAAFLCPSRSIIVEE